MRVHTFLIVVALAIGGTSTADAQPRDASAPTERPTVGPPRPFTPPARHERTLSNGLRIVVVRHPTVPKVSAVLTLRTGVAADPADRPGLAAFVADAVQEGTKSRTSQEIRTEAFGMGGSLTATVSQDATVVSVRGLSAYTDGLVALLADVVRNPTFPEEELTILKANRLQELEQQKSSPQFLSNREFRRALFGDHPYARVTATPDAVTAIDRAALSAFHTAHYRPNHAVFIVVGDVTPETVFAAAEKSFGSWEKGDVPSSAFPDLPALEGRKVVFVQRPNSIQSSISVGNFSVNRADPRWYELTVANTIYGGAFNSRIIRNIREEKGYTYSPFSQFAAFGDAGFYRFAADVRSEVTGATLTEVYKEIDLLRKEGAAGAELEGAKQYLRGVFLITTKTQAGLANALTTIYTYELPANYLETYQEKISAVTPEAVREAARTLLGSSDSVIVIVGDYPAVKDQLIGLGEIVFLDIEGKRLPGPPSAEGSGAMR